MDFRRCSSISVASPKYLYKKYLKTKVLLRSFSQSLRPKDVSDAGDFGGL